ncbi:MAG: hypothetical protein J5441_00620 [Clostridia bacterium]|nr:hypothetical protein [Clostridia bacterium]
MREELKKYAWRKFRRYPKTKEITDLRDELYSMMCDKYDDLTASGVDESEAARQARELMNDCTAAVREAEVGSSMGALRRMLIGLLTFSAAFMLALTCVYLFLSLVTFGSFDKTWLLMVAGSFVYVVYVAVKLYNYARSFGFSVLTRSAFGGIFLSLVPLLFVLPCLGAKVLFGADWWGRGWLVALLIAALWLTADTMLFARGTKAFWWELVGLGFLVTTIIFLAFSVFTGAWNVAWLVYVLYLVIVAFAIYFAELRRRRRE